MAAFRSSPLDDLQTAVGQAQSSGSTGASKTVDPPVYMGGVMRGNPNPVMDTLNPRREAWKTGNPVIDILHPAKGRKVPSPSIPGSGTVKTQSEALLEFYQWSPEQRNQWGDYLASIGYLAPDKARDYNSLRTAWNDVIEQGAAFTAAGKFVNPHDVAKMMAGPGTSGSGSGSEPAFTGTKSTTSTSVDLTDPATAKALVNGVLAQTLGRDANPEELAQFRQTLAAAEQASPTKTTTSTTYNAGDATSQSSTSSGGLTSTGKQQLIQDRAMQKPDYGAYQASTTYFNALLGALKSPV